MTSQLDLIKTVLSDKRISVAIILLSIIGRVIQLIYFFNIRLDASHQVIATRNFLEGHGISMAKAYTEDISSPIYEPLINWPPGYSVLLAPIYALFNGNYIAAGITLSIVAAIALILVSRSILKLLDVPIYLVNLMTIISGFFIYFFYFIASSDAITISLAMIAVYYSLLMIKSQDHWLKHSVIITLVLFMCGAIKYLFIPVVLVIPVYLAWKGIAEKNKRLTRSGSFSMLALLIAFGVILAWQKSISGSATYISEPGRGFFPNNLLAFFPFIPGSFIKPDTISLMLPGSGFVNSVVFAIFQLVHVILMLLLSFFLLRLILKYGIKHSSLLNDFFYLILFISWAITILLAILSIQVEKEAWDGGHFWTYIEEQRYYGWPMVMIQLAAFIYYHHWRDKLGRFKQFFIVGLFLLMMIEVARGVIFDFKRVARFGKEEYSWQSEYRLQQYADNLIRQSLQKRTAKHVVVGGPFYYVNHRVSLYSNVPLLDKPASINNMPDIKAKETTLLLVILAERDLKNFQSFLQAGIEVAGQFNGLYFYTVYVDPQ